MVMVVVVEVVAVAMVVLVVTASADEKAGGECGHLELEKAQKFCRRFMNQ